VRSPCWGAADRQWTGEDDHHTGLANDNIRKQGLSVVKRIPAAAWMAHAKLATVTARAGGLDAAGTFMDLPTALRIIHVVESACGSAVKLPDDGWQTPAGEHRTAARHPHHVIPIWNHDNNQHTFARESPDSESLKWDRIDGGAADDMNSMMPANLVRRHMSPAGAPPFGHSSGERNGPPRPLRSTDAVHWCCVDRDVRR